MHLQQLISGDYCLSLCWPVKKDGNDNIISNLSIKYLQGRLKFDDVVVKNYRTCRDKNTNIHVAYIDIVGSIEAIEKTITEYYQSFLNDLDIVDYTDDEVHYLLNLSSMGPRTAANKFDILSFFEEKQKRSETARNTLKHFIKQLISSKNKLCHIGYGLLDGSDYSHHTNTFKRETFRIILDTKGSAKRLIFKDWLNVSLQTVDVLGSEAGHSSILLFKKFFTSVHSEVVNKYTFSSHIYFRDINNRNDDSFFENCGFYGVVLNSEGKYEKILM